MKKLFTMFMIAAFTFAVVACDNKSEKEEASESIEEATEDTGDAIEESAEETKEEINEAADTVMNDTEEVIEE